MKPDAGETLEDDCLLGRSLFLPIREELGRIWIPSQGQKACGCGTPQGLPRSQDTVRTAVYVSAGRIFILVLV